MKLKWMLSIAGLGIVILDRSLTYYADHRIRARDADFSERYAEVKDQLDWD